MKAKPCKEIFFLFCVLAFLIVFSQLIFAEGRVNFVLGKVYASHKGRKWPVKRGMLIPDKALILTGKRSRVSIYNYKSRKLVFVSSNASVSWNQIAEKSSSNSIFIKLLRNSLIKIKPVTVIASARAIEEGKTKIYWDEGDEKPKIDRSKEWELYKNGQYLEVLSNINSSKDTESIFLSAMSMYQLYGVEKEKEIMKKLNLLERAGRDKALQAESLRMQGLISFEVGKYDDALKYLNKYIRFKEDKNIRDLEYYMFVVCYRNLGRDIKAREFHRKMRKYYSNSKLLGIL